MAGPRIGLANRRVLVFTQFRDTAVYLDDRLRHFGVGPVALTHGGSSPGDRARIAATFDPDCSLPGGPLLRASEGVPEPRVLVSTDVLAEGHNLQLAEAVINFDLHWNPQVAVQRSGRVDRLNSPHNVVYLVSFLPEEGLNHHLGLIERLNARFNLYKLLGLADEAVTRLPAEQQAGTSLEQLRRLYRDDSGVLDDIEQALTLGSTDYMRQPLELFLARSAREALAEIPLGVQSCKRLPPGWAHGSGVFTAFAFGPPENSETFWRFYPRLEDGWGAPIVDDPTVFRAIVCQDREPRQEPPGSWINSSSPVLIDWELLRHAASEIAEALTLRRSTAAVTRGASERSARLRADLLGLAGGEAIDGLDDLLDRLEQVRIEDYDARAGYRTVENLRRRARRTEIPSERRAALLDLVARSNDLLGPPEETEPIEASEVEPSQLRLVAWELLVLPPVPGVASFQLSLLEHEDT